MKLLISFCIIFQLLLTQALAYDCSPNEFQVLKEQNFSSIEKLDKGIKCKSDSTKLLIDEAVVGCLFQAFKGAMDYIGKSLESIAQLGELIYTLGAKFGSFMADYLMAVWNGTEALFWAENYIQGDKFINDLIKTFKMLPEFIVNYFTESWEGFQCMKRQDQIEKVCHAVTYIGPDILLFGSAVWKTGGALAAKIGPRLSRFMTAQKAVINATSTERAVITVERTVELAAKTGQEVNKKAKKLEALANKVSYHPRPREVYEFEKIGKIINKASDLKNLDDGAYLFVVDTNGNLAITQRFPNLSGKGEVLAGHPALKNQLNTLGNHKVASAGEFYVDGGVVTEINNKSGRFWGGKDHLDFGVETLKNKGLEVPDGVKIFEVEAAEKEITKKLLAAGKDPTDQRLRKSYRDPMHHSEKEIADFIMTAFKNDKNLAKEFDNFKSAYRGLAQNSKYKSAKLGQIDFDKAFDRMLIYSSAHPDSEDVIMAASYYISNVTNESSRHFKGFKGLMKYSKETREEALHLIQEMAKE